MARRSARLGLSALNQFYRQAPALAKTTKKRANVAALSYDSAAAALPAKRVKVENKEEEPAAAKRAKANATPKAKAAPKAKATSKAKAKAEPKAKAKAKATPTATVAAPANWRPVLENIKTMRAAGGAPVDTIGCAELPKAELPDRTRRFQCLVSLMLSSLTKDEMTSKAVRALQALPDGLTPESVIALSDDDLREAIRCVGFYNQKTKSLKKTSQILLEKYDGDIPRSIKELTALPGVGPKMAFLAMQEAWGDNVGIGVDVHVHRISNTLGWVKTAKPEETRVALESWLPEEEWGPINKLLVGFGQIRCKARKPLCGDCLNRQLCPVGKKWKPDVKSRKK